MKLVESFEVFLKNIKCMGGSASSPWTEKKDAYKYTQALRRRCSVEKVFGVFPRLSPKIIEDGEHLFKSFTLES